MSRNYHPHSIAILKFLGDKKKPIILSELKKNTGPKLTAKDFYNYVFRLSQQELVERTDNTAIITEEGSKLLRRLVPQQDGVWKLVIFDIPEKQGFVRGVLRAKLKSLHFKKWQNSIWASPYQLDEEVEAELKVLAKKYFVRLIKTVEINEVSDLEKLFG